ncbi:MAG TPA: hypothetical protein VNS19_00195 [Acidimicrobiales bacterium]|jgi:hypothetical protein|nr:hypothetical protein [Acidimicrobiales bacterium]
MLALLLAFGALAIPVAGAALTSAVSMPGGSQLALGAVSSYDFLPVLMLVGALGILVIGADGRSDAASARASSAGVVVVLASGLLALAYLVSAYQLRAGGPFDGDASGEVVGWSFTRVTAVGSLLVTGVLCATVLALAARWIGERKAGRS